MAHKHPSTYGRGIIIHGTGNSDLLVAGGSVGAVSLDNVMGVTLASHVPYGGGAVLVDEGAYKATATSAQYATALGALDSAVNAAEASGAPLQPIANAVAKVGAAKAVRDIANSPAATAQVQAQADAGDRNAAAVATAIGVSKVTDMKQAAMSCVAGAMSGDAASREAVRALQVAAQTPGPQQAHATAMMSMVGACCQACADAEEDPDHEHAAAQIN